MTNSNPKNLILASQSPRRADLFRERGYDFRVISPDPAVEQGLCSHCTPDELVVDWATKKAWDVRRSVTEGLIVAADTVAELNGQILGKPRDEDDARRMLTMLSGQTHRVLTGVCLLDVPSERSLQKLVVSILRMDSLRTEQIADYLATDQWVGKAGAFGFQDGPDWLHLIDGLASNVVGFPIEWLPAWISELTLENASGSNH